MESKRTPPQKQTGPTARRSFGQRGIALALVSFALIVPIMFGGGQRARAQAPPSVPPAAVPKKRASYVPPTAELFKKLNPAVAKVVIKKYGVPIATGSGFFATADGVFMTSRRFVRQLLIDAATTAEFTLSDKTVIRETARELRVLPCPPLGTGTLCALKLTPNPKTFFTTAEAAPNEGEGTSMIGYFEDDAAIARGTVTQVSADQHVTVNGPFGPGSEGAPAFDDQGRLVGVVGKYDPERSEIHAISPLKEVRAFTTAEPLPVTLGDARRAVQETVRAEIRRRSAELDPALGFAGRSKSLDGLPGFKDVGVVFDDRILRITLPEAFDDCPVMQKSRESTLHACYAFGDSAVLTVRRLPNKGFEDLLAKNGTRLVEPKPLAFVDELSRAEAWGEYEKNLSPAQKRAFVSDPTLAQCQLVKPSTLAGAAFSNAPACRFAVTNDTETGGYSLNVWLLKDQYLYVVAMWMNNAALGDYLSRIPILAILTSRWEKSIDGPSPARGLASALSPRPIPTYRVEMPETVSFMGAKIRGAAKGGQIDLYGKKLLLDRFEDGFVVGVTNQKTGFLPPDFNDFTKKTMGEVTKALGAKVDLKTLEIEPTNATGKPGRLLTVFGRDGQGRDVLVLTSTVFYEDQAFGITQIAISKDPGETFREFKDFLAGFRRQ